MQLFLCIVGLVLGSLLLIFVSLVVASSLVTGWDEPSVYLSIFGGIGGVILLVFGIVKCDNGNKAYDKVTKIYSLQPSDHFILGTSKGYYYYNLNETDVMSCIDKISTKATLIQTNDIDYPYLLEHKVKWEESEFSLYVPEDTRIIQYSVK